MKCTFRFDLKEQFTWFLEIKESLQAVSDQDLNLKSFLVAPTKNKVNDPPRLAGDR